MIYKSYWVYTGCFIYSVSNIITNMQTCYLSTIRIKAKCLSLSNTRLSIVLSPEFGLLYKKLSDPKNSLWKKKTKQIIKNISFKNTSQELYLQLIEILSIR